MLFLAWVAVISLPAAAVEGGLIAGLDADARAGDRRAAPGMVAGASPAEGVRSAPRCSPWPAWSAVLGWGVYVLNPWAMLAQGARWLAWWFGERTLPSPSLDAFAAQGEALARFWQRVSWWVEGLVTGRGGADNLVVVALACLLVWAVAAWAGWWLARNGKPFVALLPTGILLANQVYWVAGLLGR